MCAAVRREYLGGATHETESENDDKGTGRRKTATSLTANLTCLAKGHLDVYRYCDEVWTFIVEKPVFRFDGGGLDCPDKVKIIARASKSASPV